MKPSADQVAKLLEEGMSPLDICTVFDVTMRQVQQVLKTRDIVPREDDADLAAEVRALAKDCIREARWAFRHGGREEKLRVAGPILGRMFGALGGAGNEDMARMRVELDALFAEVSGRAVDEELL